MINSDSNPTPSSTITSISMVPVGGIAQVLRSGDAYKAVGEVVSRAAYPALSAAFPLNGSFSSVPAVTDSGSATLWNSIASGSGVYVMVGGADGAGISGAKYSDNGIDWTPVNMGFVAVWTSITYGGGKFVAVGYTGTLSSPTGGYRATSTDGINWVVAALPAVLAYFTVTHNGTVFCAIAYGSNAAATSTDGTTWTARTLPSTSNWVSVASNASGLLVAISNGTAAATSADGTTWTARTFPSTGAKTIICGNGLFVVIGPALTNYHTSNDGVTWVSPATPYGNLIFSISYGNGCFLMTRGIHRFVSTDAAVWRHKNGFSFDNGTDISTYGSGRFIIGRGLGANMDVNYAENFTTSDYLYLSGTAGQFVRVK